MNNKENSEQIIFTNHIMNSDEDASIVQELCVGFTNNHKLVVSINHFDYNDPRYNCSTWAVVNADDAYRLSRRLQVSLHKLPMAICEYMSDWCEIVNPSVSQVQACFKEITECLLDEGCHFRIRRSYGLCGFYCC